MISRARVTQLVFYSAAGTSSSGSRRHRFFVDRTDAASARFVRKPPPIYHRHASIAFIVSAQHHSPDPFGGFLYRVRRCADPHHHLARAWKACTWLKARKICFRALLFLTIVLLHGDREVRLCLFLDVFPAIENIC
jgi:hypothetical protein